jgi:hypothetical protein
MCKVCFVAVFLLLSNLHIPPHRQMPGVVDCHYPVSIQISANKGYITHTASKVCPPTYLQCLVKEHAHLIAPPIIIGK